MLPNINHIDTPNKFMYYSTSSNLIEIDMFTNVDNIDLIVNMK